MISLQYEPSLIIFIYIYIFKKQMLLRYLELAAAAAAFGKCCQLIEDIFKQKTAW